MITSKRIFQVLGLWCSFFLLTGFLFKIGQDPLPETFYDLWIQPILSYYYEFVNYILNWIVFIKAWANQNFFELQTQNSLWWQSLIAFSAGVSVSLTPCIYPLLPVTTGILSSNHHVGIASMLFRSIFYLLGQSVVFSLLAMVAVKFNLLFGVWLSNPWVMSVVIGFLVVLALSLFEIIDLDFLFIQTKLPLVSGIFSAFLFGAITGIVSSPCMTPALLALLGYVSRQPDSLAGYILLVSFAIGMNFIIILVSVFSNLIFYLPRPGEWMLEFKKVLGFGIIYLCIGFLDPFLDGAAWKKYLLQGLFALFVALYYYFDSKKDSVAKLIKAHKKFENDPSMKGLGLSAYVSPTIMIKNLVALLAFGIGLYWLGRSYLLFKRTKLFTILLKLLR